MVYEKSLGLLKGKDIKFEKGLSINEVNEIEKVYRIKFPDSLRNFLMEALPVSRGFYNWRDMSNDNVSFIKDVIKEPLLDVYNMAGEVYCCDEWGNNKESMAKEVKRRLETAPALLPVFSHRYIPMLEMEKDPPIISIHGVDIIYYGKNLKDYFDIEFGTKNQAEIEFDDIIPIPFWSEIM